MSGSDVSIVTRDERFVLYFVPWSAYVAFRDSMEHGPTIISRLVELWAMERDADLNPYGRTTCRNEATQCGLDPDECYKRGVLEEGGVPDIAIDVVLTPSLVDKMAVYAGIGVPEVWVWQPETSALLVANRLVGAKYEQCDRSAVLPDLDLVELSRFVRPSEGSSASLKAYQAAIRAL